MKRLAILCDLATDTGGAERYWATVLPKLRERYDVSLFARVVEPGSALGAHARQVDWSYENDPPSARAAAQLSQALRGFDLVMTANVFDALALQAVRACGARWGVRVHDHRAFCPNGNKVFPQLRGLCEYRMGAACVASTFVHGCVRGPRPSSLRRIARRLRVRDALARADVVIAAGTYMRDLCVQNRIPPERMALLPPPLDDALFADEPPEPGTGVLYAGRIEEEKGLLTLVRAIGSIAVANRPRLSVAGRGSEAYEREVRDAARRLDVETAWLGFLSQAELRERIDQARIFALPSLWPEPFGLAGTQALARGRPVVAYDVGGVRSWLRNAGAAVRRGDERALGAAIESLCTDDVRWARAAQNARAGAQDYRLDAHMQRFIEIIDSG